MMALMGKTSMDYGSVYLVCQQLEKQGHLATKQEKEDFHKDPTSFVKDNPGQPRFILIIDRLLTILQIQLEANLASNNNTIAIKTARTDNGKSRSRNANLEI